LSAINFTAVNDAPVIGATGVVLTGATEDTPFLINYADLMAAAPVQVTIFSASTSSSFGAGYTGAKTIDGIKATANNGWYSSNNGLDTNPKLTLDV
jgi:hypothetical protein